MERFIWSLVGFVESGRDDNTNGREYLKSKWMLMFDCMEMLTLKLENILQCSKEYRYQAFYMN